MGQALGQCGPMVPPGRSVDSGPRCWVWGATASSLDFINKANTNQEAALILKHSLPGKLSEERVN